MVASKSHNKQQAGRRAGEGKAPATWAKSARIVASKSHNAGEEQEKERTSREKSRRRKGASPRGQIGANGRKQKPQGR